MRAFVLFALGLAGWAATDGLASEAQKMVPKPAGNICWVERIQKRADGLHVHFIRNARLQVRVIPALASEKPREYSVSAGVVRSGSGQSPYLLLKDGDEVIARQLSHDTCTFEAVDTPKRAGMTASSVMHLPGFPPAKQEEFIEASR